MLLKVWQRKLKIATSLIAGGFLLLFFSINQQQNIGVERSDSELYYPISQAHSLHLQPRTNHYTLLPQAGLSTSSSTKVRNATDERIARQQRIAENKTLSGGGEIKLSTTATKKEGFHIVTFLSVFAGR